MALEIANGFERTADVIELFDEYTKWIVSEDPAVAEVLRAQGYGEETASLDGKYGPPGGMLLLALVDGAAAGCAALHAFGEERSCGGCSISRASAATRTCCWIRCHSCAAR